MGRSRNELSPCFAVQRADLQANHFLTLCVETLERSREAANQRWFELKLVAPPRLLPTFKFVDNPSGYLKKSTGARNEHPGRIDCENAACSLLHRPGIL